MADHVDITLRIDWRWEDAIEKHLRDETLEEHLEDVLDEICNQLPEREYKRISAEIYAEDAARRTEEEAARTYAAYHVVENGRSGTSRPRSVRSCWMPRKSCAAMSPQRKALYRICSSKCLRTAAPSQRRSTTRSLPFAWRTPARCAACSM